MPSPLLPLPELEIRASSLAAQGRLGATGGRRRLLAVLGLPPAKRRGGGGGTLTARGPEPAPCPGGRTHQPGVRTWPLLACPQERRPGARREEGALAATAARGSQPFRAICPILFPPTLNLFSSAAQPVSYFLPHSEARAPQTLAKDFPEDEIRSKRGSVR